MADSHVNTDHVLICLVQDRVDRDGGFAGLAVTNDQLTLATTHRNHRVDGGDSGLHRLMHRFPLNDARGHRFDQPRLRGSDIAFAIDRTSEGVDDTPQHGVAHGNRGDFAGGFHRAAFLNAEAFTHQHRADVVVFEVQSDPFSAILEFEELTCHGLLEAVNAGDSITHLQNGTDIADGN